jgi:hypothetical protein
MKPCNHVEVEPRCRICCLYATREDYRNLWDGLPPHLVVLPIARPLPCVFLGKLIQRAGCNACPRNDLRICDHGHGTISQARECETCPDYEQEQ